MFSKILRFTRLYLNFCESIFGTSSTTDRPDVKALNELLALTGGYRLHGQFHYPEILPKHRERVIQLCEFVLAYRMHETYSNVELANMLIEIGNECESKQSKDLKQAGEHILDTRKKIEELLERAKTMQSNSHLVKI